MTDQPRSKKSVAPETPESAPQPASAEDGDLITRNLRSLFRSVEEESLPDDLQALLDKLADTEDRQ